MIPSSLTADQLTSSLGLIKKFEFDPPIYDDGKTALDFLRSKAAAERARQPRTAYDDDSDGSEDEEFLFPAGGPTNRKSDALEKLKKRRRVQRRTEGSDVDDEEKERKAEETRAKRREAELEKRRKIKSDLFIHDSDEDEDEERDKEFFAKEEAVRKQTADAVARALMEARKSVTGGKSSKKRKAQKDIGESRKKRKSTSDDGDGEDESGDDLLGLGIASSRSSSVDTEDPMIINSSDEDAEAAIDTPISSQQPIPDPDEDGTVTTDPTNKPEAISNMVNEDEELSVTKPSRRTFRAGFIVDSDSDE